MKMYFALCMMASSISCMNPSDKPQNSSTKTPVEQDAELEKKIKEILNIGLQIYKENKKKQDEVKPISDLVGAAEQQRKEDVQNKFDQTNNDNNQK